MHITASVFINDSESGPHHDYERWLDKPTPHEPISQYRHNRTGEDNGGGRLKRQVMGREGAPATGKPDLGTWERIFYGEFDGRRKKRVLVKIIGEWMVILKASLNASKEDAMRLMLRFTIPVEKGNEAAADGTLPQDMKDLVDHLKAESAYFYVQDGKRAGEIVFEESDASRLTMINEPLFAKLNAAIDIKPVLNLEELLKGL